MTLYELTNDYMELLQMAEDPDIEEDVFRDTLEGIVGAIEDKAEAYAIIIGELTAKADHITAEAKRLNAWADSLTSCIPWMKSAQRKSRRSISALVSQATAGRSRSGTPETCRSSTWS